MAPSRRARILTDNGMVLPFSVSYEHLKRNPRLVDVFIYFFDQEAKLGYYREMQSNKLKSAESNLKKNNIAKFARVKKLVKLMLMNTGSYPGKKPTDPKLLVLWQEDLLKLGRQAENNTYKHFAEKIPYDKFNVSNVLTNRSVCKQMQLDLKLPANTPAEELQFFNS
jgi:predicted metal-dependent HD superfamily phosphohydrolase